MHNFHPFYTDALCGLAYGVDGMLAVATTCNHFPSSFHKD
jgi:hypothetical protein